MVRQGQANKGERFIRWLVWGSFLSLLCFALGFVLQSDWTKVQRIEIVKSASSSPILFERIRNSVEKDVKSNEGLRIWQVSLRKLRDMVQKDKRVKDVSIRRRFPGDLQVVVEPYSPVMMFLDNNGKVFPLAKDATLLPAVSRKEFADVPILRGEGLRESMELREQAIQLLEEIPEQGTFRRSLVSEIVYRKNEGFQIFVSQFNSELKFGDTDLGLKVSRVGRVLSYLENQNIKSRVIDARFSKKVVVRARNAP